MEPHNTFFVTGATGNQGSATTRNLIENGFTVKALVRHPDSPKAQALKRANIEIITGDLDDPLSYKASLKNIAGAFLVITFSDGINKEIARGKSFIDAAKEMNVPFVLYSSVIGADAGTGIPHWESKNLIEQHLIKSGIAFTIVRPASFYENFFIPDVSKRIKKGSLITPVRKGKFQQFISTEDVGKICAHILINKEKFKGRTITIAADEMEMDTAAGLFAKSLNKPVKYSQLPALLTRIFMGRDLNTMFSYINKHEVLFVKNMAEIKNEFPFLMPMDKWIENNKSSFMS